MGWRSVSESKNANTPMPTRKPWRDLCNLWFDTGEAQRFGLRGATAIEKDGTRLDMSR